MLYFGINYRIEITEFILKEFVNEKFIVSYENNIYAKGNTEEYQVTDNFYPKNKDDILNIFFTALNGGWENITFFCTNEYKECFDDVKDLANNSNELSKINNYVHPYNSYRRIVLDYNMLGKISISIEKLYNNYDIKLINEKVDSIIDSYLTSNMSTKDKIKVIHDYIINNTKYDEVSAEKVKKNMKLDSMDTYKANGPLINGKAICGGYSDAMAIFLSKLGLENYKLFSDIHVWNYVLINNNWYHLDLTWDDPVTNIGKDILLHTFFLISDKELKDLNTNEHNYY